MASLMWPIITRNGSWEESVCLGTGAICWTCTQIKNFFVASDFLGSTTRAHRSICIGARMSRSTQGKPVSRHANHDCTAVFATGSFQEVVGDVFGLARMTVHRCSQ